MIIVTVGVVHMVSGMFMDRFEQKVEIRRKLEKDVAMLSVYANNEQVRQNAGEMFSWFPSQLESLQQRPRFYDVADRTGVEVLSLEQGISSNGAIPAISVESSEKQSASESARFTRQVNTLAFSLSIEGEFENHLAFLRELYNTPPFTEVVSVSFDSPQGTTDREIREEVIVSTVDVVLYYQK